MFLWLAVGELDKQNPPTRVFIFYDYPQNLLSSDSHGEENFWLPLFWKVAEPGEVE
ncbi:hypothetical protein [Komarekiella delphini-convector]|uniref:hypothetical protein n=1 Tax=Komarekiella delphini-convector TaxID=3050158 RepID=UPI001781150F|nr:hypothetical protein [Komarekiella delphini-convector]